MDPDPVDSEPFGHLGPDPEKDPNPDSVKYGSKSRGKFFVYIFVEKKWKLQYKYRISTILFQF